MAKKKQVKFLSKEGIDYVVNEINKDIMNYTIDDIICDLRSEVFDEDAIYEQVSKEVNAFAKKEILPAVKKYLKENKAKLIEQKINQLVARL